MIRGALFAAAVAFAGCEHMDFETSGEPACDPHADPHGCYFEQERPPYCPADAKTCEDIERERDRREGEAVG